MKTSNIVLIVIFSLLCVCGWYVAISEIISSEKEYKAIIEQADSWVEDGLYQRAIKEYKRASAMKASEELYEDIAYAYKLRYKEASKDTLEEYTEFLEGVAVKYPSNKLFADNLIDVYHDTANYEALYNCVIRAIEAGYDNEDMQKVLREAKYAYEYNGGKYASIIESVNGEYVEVTSEGGYKLYSLNDSYILEDEYEYISPRNVDGIVIVTSEKDSRLIDATGMVMGIFKEKVIDAGLYSEGYVAINRGNLYSYYDEFAKEQFGAYEAAGAFQNGMAPVKKDGNWIFINTKGEETDKVYKEVILDNCGRYIIGEHIIVKSEDSAYEIYSKDWKLKAEIKCNKIDICTSDGLIAICVDNKWGYVNTDGKIVIEPQYEDAKSFSNGVAAVCKNGIWGFIDKDNNLVIDYQYIKTGYMNSYGVCSVQTVKEDTEIGSLPEWKMIELVIGIKEK